MKAKRHIISHIVQSAAIQARARAREDLKAELISKVASLLAKNSAEIDYTTGKDEDSLRAEAQELFEKTFDETYEAELDRLSGLGQSGVVTGESDGPENDPDAEAGQQSAGPPQPPPSGRRIAERFREALDDGDAPTESEAEEQSPAKGIAQKFRAALRGEVDLPDSTED